jgi:N-acetylglucosamine kinase-like BadF-type ATPase
MREHLGAEVDLDVLDVVLNHWRGERGRVAALCPVVVAAAEAGDACAGEIVDDAARELVALVDAARWRLGFAPDAQVPVSYSGGAFNAARLRRAFERDLAASDGGYRLLRPAFAPVVGAALYAARRSGSALDADALRRLRESG